MFSPIDLGGSTDRLEEAYRGRRALVTGGLGFIGSNLSHALAQLGAKVTIVDTMLPRHGGNLFNIEGIRERISLHITDIRSAHSMNHIVKDHDFAFHLAGQVNHIDSIRNPLQDLDINAKGTLILLESLRNHAPEARLVFVGTRGQYGKSVSLPVNEEHPQHPKGIYAISNIAAENMVMIYHDVHRLQSTCLRLTNTFGPRHQMAHDEFGVFNWFIRKAMDGDVIPVFGDGRILRDYIYVDDVVESLLLCAVHTGGAGGIFNVGRGAPTGFLELADTIVRVVGSGEIVFKEFTDERKALEPGDFYCDISKIKNALGWQPKTPLEDGIQKTADFYRRFREHYW